MRDAGPLASSLMPCSTQMAFCISATLSDQRSLDLRVDLNQCRADNPARLHSRDELLQPLLRSHLNPSSRIDGRTVIARRLRNPEQRAQQQP